MNCMRRDEWLVADIRGKLPMRRREENAIVRCSAACPTGTELFNEDLFLS